jgi:hypothetical protein
VPERSNGPGRNALAAVLVCPVAYHIMRFSAALRLSWSLAIHPVLACAKPSGASPGAIWLILLSAWEQA